MIKKIYSWLHLWLGVVVGLIFSIASITGAILIFEDELEPLLYPGLYHSEAPAAARRIPLDSLFERARSFAGERAMMRVQINSQDATAAYLFRSDGERLDRVFLGINPYTGALQSRVEGRQHLFSLAEDLHRQLFMGKLGKAITGACCLSYIVVLITGLLLWWPKNKKIFKQRLKIKWDAKAKRLNWDAHAVGGFYTLPILFLIALTGLTWSYRWFNDGIFYIFDGKPQTRITATFAATQDAGVSPAQPIEKAYQEALLLLPYAGTIQLSLPDTDETAIEVSREQEHAAIPNVVDRLFFDKHSAKLVHTEPYDKQSRGMKVRRFVLPLHAGSFGGITTKVLYVLVVLFASTLPFTGFFIWWGKKKKGKKKTPAGRKRLKIA